MEPNFNPDKRIAETLAAPFTPRSQGHPLAYKPLHDGGMVVVIADGRKLWFSASEVQAARREIHEQAEKESAPRSMHTRFPVKLAPAEPEQNGDHGRKRQP